MVTQANFIDYTWKLTRQATVDYFRPLISLPSWLGTLRQKRDIESNGRVAPLKEQEIYGKPSIEVKERSVKKTLVEAEREARELVNAWSVGAAAVGWVPGSMLALVGVDAKLVKDVAKAFGIDSYSIEEVSAVVGAVVVGKVIAAETLSLFPGVGWLAKSGIAAVVIKSAGEAMIQHFKPKSPYA